MASISKFEGKGPIGLPGGDSVKGHHLLPFLPAFTAFVTRLQELLVGMCLHWSLLSGHLKAACAVWSLPNIDTCCSLCICSHVQHVHDTYAYNFDVACKCDM